MSQSLRVTVLNTLPSALHAYTEALASTLDATGMVGALCVLESSVEIGTGMQRRARALGDLVSTVAQQAALGEADLVLDVWPAAGRLEPLIWMRHRARRKVRIVVHDPVPLRRQFGTGAISRWVGSAVGRWSGMAPPIAHSDEAREVLDMEGYIGCRVLPHPIRVGNLSQRSRDRTVAVIGQWKPERALEGLERVGARLVSRGWNPLIAGRGWPAVPGWDARPGFLTEVELDDLLDGIACLVVPYRLFFQSGMALRALERGCPTVITRKPHTEAVWGTDWPGLIDNSGADGVVDAVEAAIAGARTVPERRASYQAKSVRKWSEFLGEIRAPR